MMVWIDDNKHCPHFGRLLRNAWYSLSLLFKTFYYLISLSEGSYTMSILNSFSQPIKAQLLLLFHEENKKLMKILTTIFQRLEGIICLLREWTLKYALLIRRLEWHIAEQWVYLGEGEKKISPPEECRFFWLWLGQKAGWPVAGPRQQTLWLVSTLRVPMGYVLCEIQTLKKSAYYNYLNLWVIYA